MSRFMLTWPNLTIDVIYTLIVAVSCFFIFYKAYKYFRLSNHKGLRYFAAAFFFMGLSNLLSLFMPLFSTLTGIPCRTILIFGIPIPYMIHVFLAFSMSVTVFSLLLSIIWKSCGKHSDTLFYSMFVISLLMSTLWVFIPTRIVFLFLNFSILMTAAVIGSYKYFSIKFSSKKTGKNAFYIVYLLLFLFWLVDTAGNSIIRFSWQTGLALYILSTSLILTIVYRVIRISGK